MSGERSLHEHVKKGRSLTSTEICRWITPFSHGSTDEHSEIHLKLNLESWCEHYIIKHLFKVIPGNRMYFLWYSKNSHLSKFFPQIHSRGLNLETKLPIQGSNFLYFSTHLTCKIRMILFDETRLFLTSSRFISSNFLPNMHSIACFNSVNRYF